MAVGLLFEGAGVSQAQYEQVRNEVMPGNNPPAGMLYHIAGPTAQGWRVVEAWESQEALDRFFQQLGPALQKAKITGQPETFQIHNLAQP